MTARDARGRFVSDDTFAAERVLEAAVREAVRLLRSAGHIRQTPVNRKTWGANPTLTNMTHLSYEWVKPDIAEVEDVLYHAAHAVAPLLRSAS